MAETREVVRHDVEINARAAIDQLREMSRSAESAQEAITKFSSFLITNSKKWNVPVEKLRQEFKMLNAELAKSKQQTLFGNFGNNKIFNGEKAFTDAAQAAGRFQTANNGVVTSINRGSKAYDEADRAARGYKHGIDLVRTALGTLTAVGIFTFLNLIQEAFSSAVKNAKDLEASLYRLSNAERIISQGGGDVSFKGFEDGIKRIKKLTPIFSKEDIAGLVGQVAISTKELGLTERQIIDLSESIAVLNINSVENETLSQTGQKVISSLLTSNAKGVAGLGIRLGDAAIKAKALELGFLQAGESVTALTQHEKDIAKVAIAIETGQDSIAGLNEFMKTNTARIEENKAAWNDLLTTVGQLFLPLVPVMTGLFEFLTDSFNALKTIAAAFFVALSSGFTLFRMVLDGSIKSLDDLREKALEVDKVAKQIIGNLFFPEGVPDDAPDWFKNFFGDALQRAETPTGSGASAAEEETDGIAKALEKGEEKIQDIMMDARDKRLDIDENYRRKIEDANRDHADKMSDIARDVARKQEDALRNYNLKVEDINRDAAQKTAEAQDDARRDEIDKEKEFQNKLRELREQFLFDLEDALRERDARQVLRLIREYNMDKKNLEERRKLDRQEAKKDLAQKLADIERERVLKLEAAQRELAEKQAEIAIWQEREIADARRALQRKLQDARTWQQRELAEYRQYLQRKLQDLAAAIVKEYQLTAAGAQSIYNLLNGYFGASGSIGGLMAGFNNQLSRNLNNIINSSTSGGSSQPVVSPTWAAAGNYMAEGGTMIATRPTRAVFGERGPEMATFTPLGRTGQDVNKVFGSLGGGGSDSMINLRIGLESGLIADIVDASMDNVAATIEKIRREK